MSSIALAPLTGLLVDALFVQAPCSALCANIRATSFPALSMNILPVAARGKESLCVNPRPVSAWVENGMSSAGSDQGAVHCQSHVHAGMAVLTRTVNDIKRDSKEGENL